MSITETPYDLRRKQLEEYFDRTAVDAWAKLTSNEPVGKIRATVREGRDRMRATLLGFLPEDLRGQRVLDAGCGTGALAVAAAERGADVVAIDLSPTLIGLARERCVHHGPGTIDFRVSDMLEPSLGRFDWVVAMDSLIHYRPADMVEMIARLGANADRGLAFTFAPRTPLLAIMHALGRVFPRGNRAPDLEPIAEKQLRTLIDAHPTMRAFQIERTQHIDVGFYMSSAMELVRR
ncbi:MAG: magnesium protoporphyrin IX methyltransferase [Deltaproteobacteria bacterium]|nr:magnesium protoporphyrin IX methyltransferase [Deltaproteobacteria bacterium]